MKYFTDSFKSVSRVPQVENHCSNKRSCSIFCVEIKLAKKQWKGFVSSSCYSSSSKRFSWYDTKKLLYLLRVVTTFSFSKWTKYFYAYLFCTFQEWRFLLFWRNTSNDNVDVKGEAPWFSGECRGLTLSHGPWTWVQFPGSPKKTRWIRRTTWCHKERK